MTAFMDLDRQVLRECPQVDVITLEDGVRRAARRFCEKTLVLEATASPRISLVAGQAEYALPAVANRDIVRVKRKGLWFATEFALKPTSEDQLDLEEENGLSAICNPWRTATDVKPTRFYQPRPDVVRLVPIPSVAYAAYLGATYHLKPSLNSTEVDNFVIDNWYEVIVHGALAEILSVKQKPWTDQVRSAEFEAKFLDGMDHVVSERVSGFASNDYPVGRVRAYP